MYFLRCYSKTQAKNIIQKRKIKKNKYIISTEDDVISNI